MPTRSVVCPLHVGRDEELSAVRGSLARVGAGDGGRTLLIGGEAGVGKSRLAGDATRLAETEGFLILSGACTEGASTAFAPVVAALRRHTRTADDASLRRLFDGPARLAATLVPEVSELVGAGGSGTAATAEDLHAATWHLVRRLGAARPVLLLLEDIHWADPDTMRLMAHLVSEAPTLPLWLVATYRVDELHRRHPLTPLLAHMRRAQGVDEVRLTPLDREQVRAMVSALFGGTSVSDEFVDAVRSRTTGNPFFIEELCTVLVERGDIYRSGDEWDRRSLDQIELPETVRETLLARVAHVDDSTAILLRIAAVAGERVDADALVIAAEASREAVDRAMVEALDRQLLVERRDGGTTHYAFRHALTREALADELVGPERQHVHRRVAEALASIYTTDPDAVAAEISDHFSQAGVTDRAAEYALRAARRAARLHAYIAAGEHYSNALRLLGDDAPDRLELLLEAAEATVTDQDRTYSTSFAREARAIAQRGNNAVAEARAMRWLWQDLWRNGDSTGALALNREALALVEGRDDWTEAWALQQLTRHLAIRGARDEARALIPRAQETAVRAGHGEALAQIHTTRAILGRTDDEYIEAFDEAIRAAKAAGSLAAEVNSTTTVGYISLWRGHMDRARELLARAGDLADRVLPGQAGYVHGGSAWARSVTGDYDGALAEAMPLRDAPAIPTRMVALTALAEVTLRRGLRDDAATYAAENLQLAEANGEGQRIDPALAHVTRVNLLNDSHAADVVVRRFIDGSYRPSTHALVSPDVVNALAQQGDRARIAQLLDVLRELTTADPNRHNRAAQALCEGIALAADGAHADALLHLTEAVDVYRSMPYPAREADALLALADVETRCGRTAEALGAARAVKLIAERLQSTPLAEAADGLLHSSDADLVLATVLITDIVGSTEIAARLGDRAWRELLVRHNAIVRRELERHRGREIDTAGDGFIAAFESPARAIRCAQAVLSALNAAGVDIRAGLHTGECEAVGEKLTGIAVHTAARIAAAAGSGEVLVSATVRELVAGAGFGFSDRGTRELRGLPGEWRLYAVDGSGSAHSQ
ncbi:MAG TPA: AAA family ATPase [Candidatus Dormibacteraeota bacterium]|nr:AAA family ATPase [Candidatus Dormibacteraeota bacterium]